MDLHDIHIRLLFLANKERNYWPPEEIDAKLHLAQMWKFNDALPNYAKDQAAQEALAPFKIRYTFTTTNTTGGLIDFSISTDESEYLHFLGMYTQFVNAQTGFVDYNQVEIVGEDEIGNRLKSQLVPLSKEMPVVMVTGIGKYQLYPKIPNSGYAHYLKKPVAPKYVYSMEGRTVNYNKSNSTQLEWSETCINEIIIKALQFLGININNGPLVQYTDGKDQQNI